MIAYRFLIAFLSLTQAREKLNTPVYAQLGYERTNPPDVNDDLPQGFFALQPDCVGKIQGKYATNPIQNPPSSYMDFLRRTSFLEAGVQMVVKGNVDDIKLYPRLMLKIQRVAVNTSYIKINKYTHEYSNAADEAAIGFLLNDLSDANEQPKRVNNHNNIRIYHYVGFVRMLDYAYCSEVLFSGLSKKLNSLTKQFTEKRISHAKLKKESDIIDLFLNTANKNRRFLFLFQEYLDGQDLIRSLGEALKKSNTLNQLTPGDFPDSSDSNEWSKINPSITYLAAMLIQVLSSIYYAYKSDMFIHGDLHLGNIVMNITTLDYPQIYEFTGQQDFDSKNTVIDLTPLQSNRRSVISCHEFDINTVEQDIYCGGSYTSYGVLSQVSPGQLDQKTKNSIAKLKQGEDFSTNTFVQFSEEENLYFQIDQNVLKNRRAVIVDFGRSQAVRTNKDGSKSILKKFSEFHKLLLRPVTDIRMLGFSLCEQLPLKWMRWFAGIDFDKDLSSLVEENESQEQKILREELSQLNEAAIKMMQLEYMDDNLRNKFEQVEREFIANEGPDMKSYMDKADMCTKIHLLVKFDGRNPEKRSMLLYQFVRWIQQGQLQFADRTRYNGKSRIQRPNDDPLALILEVLKLDLFKQYRIYKQTREFQES